MPLVGSVDSRRATEITERLLESFALYQAEIVILDITGVPVIDTSTANHLLMTTRAAALLGSQVILVGMSAEIAQTIVHIGIELRGLVTLANLQAGIAYALGRIGLGIQPLQPARRAAYVARPRMDLRQCRADRRCSRWAMQRQRRTMWDDDVGAKQLQQ